MGITSKNEFGRRALPFALLGLALATTFLFGGDRGHFYRDMGAADHVTAHHMAVAKNLSAEHGFVGFYRQMVRADGSRVYELYNRFPPLGHALIKLATLPFPDDLSAQLFAARMLMLAFNAAAAVLAFLALSRLLNDRWAALAATLLAFASSSALYFNDTVATEGAIDLFGVMLVFHGMALAATGRGQGQLLARACVALLLGWHVYALIVPFVALGLIAAARRRDAQAAWRCLRLGAVALLFGAAVLAANFAREHMAVGGEGGWLALPSAQSMLCRMGLAEAMQIEGYPAAPQCAGVRSMVERARRADQFSSRVGVALMPHPDVVIRFLAMPPLLSRIGIASVPYAVAAPFVDDGAPPLGPKTHAWAALGVATLVGALALVALSTTRRLPLAALALLAPCWSLAMPSNWVQFEALFAVGVPLALFALALVRVGNAKLKRLAGIAAAPAFALSSFLMAEASHDPARTERERALAADFESIRKLAAGKAIFFEQPQGTIGLSRRRYFLPDSIFAVPAARRFADFIASDRPVVGVPSLTPNNRRLFLYDRIDCDAGTKAGDAIAAPAHRKPPSS